MQTIKYGATMTLTAADLINDDLTVTDKQLEESIQRVKERINRAVLFELSLFEWLASPDSKFIGDPWWPGVARWN